jgi:thiazole/oxazole-forming peptide maturase SagD family component
MAMGTETALTFILCDDLLNPALLEIVANYEALCLIKSCGEQIAFTPIVNKNVSHDYVQKLQCRLKHNNPTLALLETIDKNANLMLPYQANELLPEKLKNVLQEQLNKQLIDNRAQLTIVNRHSNHVEKHPIKLVAKGEQDFSKQILSVIKLQPCDAHFNKDGGSRTISAQDTVDSLRPFISPKTGLITHMAPLAQSAEHPVKIYSSAFFKKPALTNSFKLNNNSLVHSCMGKGVSHVQSQASALCEAVERFSAHYQGDEPLFLNKPSQLSGRYYDFQQLVPYTHKQYKQFNDVNHPDSTLKQAATFYQGQAVHWLPTWSLTQAEHVFVPMTHCFANLPFEDERYARWHSNGCAAGNTLEEAILQALFELIERDATAIWWYNRIERPAYDLSQIEACNLALLDATLAVDHDYWVLDLTHDIEVPVMVAVGQHKLTKGLSFGFGCHLQSELAAQRALTELCQLIPIRDQKGAPFDFDAVQQDAFLFPALKSKSKGSDFVSSGDIKVDIETIVEKLKCLQLETLVINYSRSPLPIKAAKVFVPGLCHIWPQFDNQRLYQTPVKLGWLVKPYCEKTINQHALYV